MLLIDEIELADALKQLQPARSNPYVEEAVQSLLRAAMWTEDDVMTCHSDQEDA